MGNRILLIVKDVKGKEIWRTSDIIFVYKFAANINGMGKLHKESVVEMVTPIL